MMGVIEWPLNCGYFCTTDELRGADPVFLERFSTHFGIQVVFYGDGSTHLTVELVFSEPHINRGVLFLYPINLSVSIVV